MMRGNDAQDTADAEFMIRHDGITRRNCSPRFIR
jgi:hypothetical protein